MVHLLHAARRGRLAAAAGRSAAGDRRSRAPAGAPHVLDHGARRRGPASGGNGVSPRGSRGPASRSSGDVLGPGRVTPAQKPLELILTRQLASYLARPLLIFDREVNLLFYNAPAEAILGRRFAETGEMRLADWAGIMPLYQEDGTPIPPEDRPRVVAMREGRPVHRGGRLNGGGGRERLIQPPFCGGLQQRDRHLGGVVI